MTEKFQYHIQWRQAYSFRVKGVGALGIFTEDRRSGFLKHQIISSSMACFKQNCCMLSYYYIVATHVYILILRALRSACVTLALH